MISFNRCVAAMARSWRVSMYSAVLCERDDRGGVVEE